MRKLGAVLDNILSNKLIVIIIFAFVVILFRASSFFISTHLWNEDLYLMVAENILKGHPPYSVVWDNKPPGIYLIFAASLFLFGHTVTAIRIMAFIFVTLTCFFLYLMGCTLAKDGKIIGFVAGILYALASVFATEALIPDVEIFFVLFTTLAFYLFISDEKIYDGNYESKSLLKIFLIGLTLGIGFEIKQSVLFDFLPILLFLSFNVLLRSRDFNKHVVLLKALFSIVTGFLLPFIIVTLYFVGIGNFDNYFYANFTANRLRLQGNHFSIKGIVDSFIYFIEPQENYLWILAIATPIYLLANNNIDCRERWKIYTISCWLLVVTVLISGSFSQHLYIYYFIQLHPPLCFLGGYILTKFILPASSGISRLRQHFTLFLALSILIFAQGREQIKLGLKYFYNQNIKGIHHWYDSSGAVAEYINNRIMKGDYIFVVDQYPKIYFLTNSSKPTRYPYPPFLLLRKDMGNITGVDPIEELERIMLKKPVYVIKHRRGHEIEKTYTKVAFSVLDKLEQNLRKDYILERRFDDQYLGHGLSLVTSADDIEIYRLKTPS
jgi:4-amino-4-deoxy-L-arabinose transferase-like glycosyltransferase